MLGRRKDDHWSVAVHQFLEWIPNPNTRRTYGPFVVSALASLQINRVGEIRPRMLLSVRKEIEACPQSMATKRLRIAAVRAFLRWAHAMELLSIAPQTVALLFPTPQKPVPQSYENILEAEAGALLQACRPGRDRTMVAVMLGAGLRVSEVSALNVGDYGPGALVVRQGKGGRARTVPLRADLEAMIKQHCSTRRKDAPMFLTQRGRRGRIHAAGIREILASAARDAGLRRITPHMLRHTFAFRAYQHSNDVLRVSKLLGHRDLATTSIYLDHLNLGQLRDALPDLP